jgi:hypothetical protein
LVHSLEEEIGLEYLLSNDIRVMTSIGLEGAIV